MEKLLEALDGADMIRVCAMHEFFLAIKNNSMCIYDSTGEMTQYLVHVKKDSLTNDEKHEWLSKVLETFLEND